MQAARMDLPTHLPKSKEDFGVESKDEEESNPDERSRPSDKEPLKPHVEMASQAAPGEQKSRRLERVSSMALKNNTAENAHFRDNIVKTSRYTAWNFLPINLFEQLSQLSNFYFLIIGVLQAIPQISTTNGIPNMYIPLVFILIVSGTRAAVEDYYRHVTDNTEGSRIYSVYTSSGMFELKKSMDLRVGQVVKVNQNQPFPADVVILHSANKRGHCFVETSSLDGETDLKPKVSIAATHPVYDSEDALANLDGELTWEGPNKKLDQFTGILTLPRQESINVQIENLALRGTVLKNTDYIYGFIVYTGDDTKIRCNVKQETKKIQKSTVMRIVDKGITGMLVIQIIMCIFAAIYAGVWFEAHQSSAWYLQLQDSAALEGVLRFFTWFIILSQLVPISLVVSSEIVKTFQAYFINNDLTIYEPATDTPTLVRSSVLNEDLGQIEFIFTDKTGTLTQNRMEFRVAFVGASRFGSSETEISKRVNTRMELVKQMKAGMDVKPPPRTPYTKAVADLEASKEAAKKLGTAHMQFDASSEMLDYLWLGKAGSTAAPAPKPQKIKVPVADASDTDPPTPTQRAAPSAYDDEWSVASPQGLWTTHRRVEFKDKEEDEKSPAISKNKIGLFKEGPTREMVQRYLLHMAISNTITPIWDEKTSEFVFQASSPDELALCKFAQHLGFELIGRNPTKLRVNKFGRGENYEEQYKHLGTLAFNSKRKRVTLIYKKDDKIMVMTKGADSNVLPLLKNSPEIDALVEELVIMAQNGLRTLVLAYSDLPHAWWDKWKHRYEEAMALPEQGDETNHQKGACADECRICKTLSDIEEDAKMNLLGATAIEDRLQDLVPETIADYLDAGIKVWMLTGDKRETAKNIGLACNLIDPDMENAEDWQRSRLIEVTGQWARVLGNRDELRMLFNSFDQNRDGNIDIEELTAYLGSLNMPLLKQNPAEVQRLFHAIDNNNDGKIDFEEFVELMRSTNLSMEEAVQSDVMLGLQTMRSYDLSKYPVSMVVEGSALAAMFPPSDSEAEKKRRKKKQKKQKKRQDSHIDIPAREPKTFTPEAIERLKDDFFTLAINCKSVVACRLTPYQKARMVKEIKLRRGVVTLAIGDGANDEAMIIEADVGVGINGLEGSAAARAADYAIAQFRFLHTLLFVHGHWSYRRIAKLVPYIFYKAIIVVIAMFYFGFFSVFSGQQLFNDFTYTFYNVLFTAAPILVLAIWDRALQRNTLEDNPRAYASILRGAYFNYFVFYEWFFRSVAHAAIIYFFVYGALQDTIIPGPDGQGIGVWAIATVMFTAIVMLATIRMLIEYVSFTFLHVFFFFLSLFGYYFVLWTFSLSLQWNPDLYGVVARIYGMASTWLVIIIAVATPVLIDYTIYAWRREFRPTLAEVLQEREVMSQEEIDRLPPADVMPPAELTAWNHNRQAELLGQPVFLDADQARKVPDQMTEARMDVIVSNWLRVHNLSGCAFSQNGRTSILSVNPDDDNDPNSPRRKR